MGEATPLRFDCGGDCTPEDQKKRGFVVLLTPARYFVNLED